MRPPAFASAGRFFRGNLHAHSNRSDGMAPVEQVLAEYRAAGYDFLVLTDHSEARWWWSVTDTTPARDDGFTTLLGVELSSADWDDEDVFSVNPIGVPPPRPTTTTRRSRGLTRPRRATRSTRCSRAATASMSQSATTPTGSTDGTASPPGSRSALSNCPRIDDVRVAGDRVQVSCSPARSVALTGIHGWRSDVVLGDGLESVALDLSRLRSPFWRITVTDADSKRAWTNPVWSD